MGALRFFLALAVLVAHSNTLFHVRFVPSNIAVEAFFIISGFYMSMILEEKYLKINNGYELFITNRLLRIYPVYWVVIIISISYCVLLTTFTKYPNSIANFIFYWSTLKPETISALILTNVIILGQDAILFLKTTSGGGLTFTPHFLTADPKLYQFEFIPQAWTLSLELMFYVLSPLLVRLKTHLLLPFTLLLLIIKFAAWQYGLNYDPWLYRFFPFELPWFLSGIISYRIYTKLQTRSVNKKLSVAVFVSVITLTACLSNISYSTALGYIYLIFIAFSVPVVFILTNKSRYDRWIGEFSYPFYICHLLCIDVSRVLMIKFNLPGQYLSVLSFFITFIISYLLIQLVGKKVDSFRLKRVKLAVNR